MNFFVAGFTYAVFLNYSLVLFGLQGKCLVVEAYLQEGERANDLYENSLVKSVLISFTGWR